MTGTNDARSVDVYDARGDLARILLRSVLACLLVHAALLGAVAWDQARDGVGVPTSTFVFALGYALGAGVALAVAEAALFRWGVLAALVLGAAASALAPLGGAFERAFVATWSSRAATDEVLRVLRESPPLAWAGWVAGAACVHAPFLIALRRGAGRPWQADALLLGTVAWIAVFLAAGAWALPEASTATFALVLVGGCVLLPLGRGAGDLVARRLLGRPARPARARPFPRRVAVLGLLIAAVVVAAPREQARTTWLRVRALRGDTGAMRALAWATHVPLGVTGVRSPSLPALIDELPGGLVDRELAAAADPSSPLHYTGVGLLRERWLLEAACWGDVEAMVELAWHIEHLGRGFTYRDQQRASCAWLRQAATAGHVPAMRELGQRLTRRWSMPDRWGREPLARTPAEREAFLAEGRRWLAEADRLDPPR